MTNTAEIHIIVAMTSDRLIGRSGILPWKLPDEMLLFKKLTMGQTIIMGRKTYENIGGALPDRRNIVVSAKTIDDPEVETYPSLAIGLERARELGEKVFCIGGKEIYRESLPLASILHISWIDGTFSGETYFPDFDIKQWQAVNEQRYKNFTYISYQRQKGQK